MLVTNTIGRKLVNELKKHFPGNADTSAIDKDAKACWLVSDGYVNLYSTEWRIPLLVAYRFQKHNNLTNPRTDKWREDVRLKTDDREILEDYKNQIKERVCRKDMATVSYDKGHFAPAGILVSWLFNDNYYVILQLISVRHMENHTVKIPSFSAILPHNTVN